MITVNSFITEVRIGLLSFVSSALPATPGTFKFASLAANNRCSMAVWNSSSQTHVSVGFTGLSCSLNENSVLTLGSLKSQLVKSHDFTTCLQDATSCSLCNTESTNLHFWYPC